MPKLLSVEDLSDILGIPVNTLYQWRTKGYGPPGVRIGKHLRYRPDDVNAWLNEQAVA
ncbi:helix-turn-helix domain-containing protein [Thermocrispum municipale]|jgi:excisionase family DNA binding protein|uniref:helix-turn-helix domain-containing protein n=1 Tax=Thermocrispum municipale TaxID=37926 RepID=UPI000402EE16|nr:helix-turn-helix domain-containing protein [Thermocrispum municipale]